jgi:hypothetical protein
MILLLLCISQFTLLFLCIIYVVTKYLDGDEMTGHRSWSKLRSFHLFGKSVTYLFGMKPNYQSDQRILFIIVGNTTNMGLFHGFGFHGSGGGFEKLDLVYMLPEILFKIPFLRDLLLWSGAVKHDENNILNLLNKGKSIAYAPHSMKDVFESKLQLPDVGILELAYRNRVQVVPVSISDEDKRYKFFFGYKGIQEWSYKRYGWPFPLLFMYRWWNKTKPPNLKVKIGVPMSSEAYIEIDNGTGERKFVVEKFKEAFLNQLNLKEEV